jgi:hypothetical protein
LNTFIGSDHVVDVGVPSIVLSFVSSSFHSSYVDLDQVLPDALT